MQKIGAPLTIRLSDETLEKARLAASESGKPLRTLLREIIESFFARRFKKAGTR